MATSQGGPLQQRRRLSASPPGRAQSPVRRGRAASADRQGGSLRVSVAEPLRPAATDGTRRPHVPPAREFPPLPGLVSLPLEALSIGSIIGKGRFKNVHRGILKSPTNDPSTSSSDKDIVVIRYAKGKAECARELQVLSRLAELPGSSQFVPRLWGACDQGRDLIVVQERATFGSLKAVLLAEDERTPRITPAHGLRIAAQVSRAMSCLQSVRVVHADLSCRNVLACRVEEDPRSVEVKVTDFGLSVMLKEGVDFENRKQPQATRWCSPETVAFQKLSHRADAWSLGTLFWELFSGGKSPWVLMEKRTDVTARLKSLTEIAQNEAAADVSGDFPAQEGYPSAAHAVLLSCLQVSEHPRPAFSALVDSFERIIMEQENPSPVEEQVQEPVPSNVSLWTPSLQDSPEPTPTLSETAPPAQGSGFGTPSTSATPNAPLHFDGGRKLKYETKLAALLADQEARLGRLADMAQVERLEGRFRPGWSAPGLPLRDFLTPLFANGQPQDPASAGIVAGGSGFWTLQSLIKPNFLRKQEFLDKADAWAAFVESADQRTSCKLRDPRGVDRASSSWLAMDQLLQLSSSCAGSSTPLASSCAGSVQLAWGRAPEPQIRI